MGMDVNAITKEVLSETKFREIAAVVETIETKVVKMICADSCERHHDRSKLQEEVWQDVKCLKQQLSID